MSNPQLLADFFSGVVDRGGLLGILALNGLFRLVTQHKFEYPQFYARLYSLLTASIFQVPPGKRAFLSSFACRAQGPGSARGWGGGGVGERNRQPGFADFVFYFRVASSLH